MDISHLLLPSLLLILTTTKCLPVEWFREISSELFSQSPSSAPHQCLASSHLPLCLLITHSIWEGSWLDRSPLTWLPVTQTTQTTLSCQMYRVYTTPSLFPTPYPFYNSSFSYLRQIHLPTTYINTNPESCMSVSPFSSPLQLYEWLL